MKKNILKMRNSKKDNCGELTKEEQKDKMRRKDNIVGIATMVVVAGLVIGAMVYSSGLTKGISVHDGDVKVDTSTGKVVTDTLKYTSAQVANEQPNMQIPGYFALDFEANAKNQKVDLGNPKENTCYFKMSLILEDGTTIWESDYLEPGRKFTQIKLNKELKKGTYENVTLNYRTYKLVNKEEQSGSNIKLTINVN